MNDDAVRRVVADILRQHLRESESPSRPIIDAEDILAAPEGSVYRVPEGALVTPLAQSTALERRVGLHRRRQPRGVGCAASIPAAGRSGLPHRRLSKKGSERMGRYRI